MFLYQSPKKWWRFSYFSPNVDNVGGKVWMKSNLMQHHPTQCNLVFKWTQHVVRNNVAWCWPNMLRPFKQAFTICFRYILYKSAADANQFLTELTCYVGAVSLPKTAMEFYRLHPGRARLYFTFYYLAFLYFEQIYVKKLFRRVWSGSKSSNTRLRTLFTSISKSYWTWKCW